MIYVCWADVSGLKEGGDLYELSAYRQEKLRAIKKQEARRLSLGAELLLLNALKTHCPELALPPRILCEEAGKPYLSDSHWKFNLSHSGRFAACALSEHAVGLDIQKPVSAREALVKRVLTLEERNWLDRAGDRDAAFTELWCRKESYIKATGKGLGVGLRSFSAAPGTEKLEYDGISYAIYHQCFPGFQLALCYPKADAPDVMIERIELP